MEPEPQIVECKNEVDCSSDVLNSMFPAESPFPAAPNRISRNFTITTDSYISLCSRMYNACCCISHPNLQTDLIPESAFQYYAIILLWKRIAQVIPESVKRQSKFFGHLASVSNSLHVPGPLYEYLQGIGSFHDPDGCYRRFALPVFPNNERIGGARWTFGKVDERTHSFYEAFPSPGIAALRIQADFRYTAAAKDSSLVWDLPEGLNPGIRDLNCTSIMPTKNLLGWALAKTLTPLHLCFLKMCGVDANFMPDNFLYGSSADRMLNEISKVFVKQCFESKRHGIITMPFKSSPCSNLNGSIIQGMTIEKHPENLHFNRSIMYCEGNFSVRSPYKSDGSLNKSAVVFGYRIARELVGVRHSWCCYDFDSYKHVPQVWIKTRNSVHTYGTVERLNETVYTTARISKRSLQNECIQRNFFLCPKDLVQYP